MPAKLTPLSPARVADLIRADRAVLIDIREPAEFSQAHVPGAISRPLSRFAGAPPAVDGSRTVVFTCRSGMRTAANCDALAAAVPGEAFVLEGGLDAWAAAGLPVARG